MWIRLKSGAESFSVNTDNFDQLRIRNRVDKSVDLARTDERYPVYVSTDLRRIKIVYDIIWKNMAFGATTFDLAHFLDTVDWSSYGVMAESDTRDMPF